MFDARDPEQVIFIMADVDKVMALSGKQYAEVMKQLGFEMSESDVTYIFEHGVKGDRMSYDIFH